MERKWNDLTDEERKAFALALFGGYHGKDLSRINSFIKRNYGNPSRVIHERMSKYVHTDIYVIQESDEQPYYTLVSLGMGTGDMYIEEDDKAYIELVLYLSHAPADKEQEDFFSWLLIDLTKYPFANETAFDEGHTLEYTVLNDKQFPYDGFVFRQSRTKCGRNAAKVNLPDSETTVRFLDLIPVYKEEFDPIHQDTQGFFSWIDRECPSRKWFADVARSKRFSAPGEIQE